MAKRKALTENQKAYRKERKRVQQFIRRAEKRGYLFPEDIIPEIPKRVTKQSLERIRAMKPSELYKTAEFVDLETGEILSGTEARTLERSRAAKKGKAKKASTPIAIHPQAFPTLSMIDRVRHEINEIERKAYPKYPLEERKEALLSIFEDTVTFYSENLLELEEYLQKNANDIMEQITIIEFDSNQFAIEGSFAILAKILNRGELSPSQAEAMAYYSDYLSSFEEY